MSYTSHGHHIPGTIKGEGTVGNVTRCGGPRICPRCKSEVASTMHLLHGESKDYQVLAKEIAAKYIRSCLQNNPDALVDGELPAYDVYIVWFAKTLQNWKAIACTTLPDNMMYELTHNGDKRETYIDSYLKTDNTVVLH